MLDQPLASACNMSQPDDPAPNHVAALRFVHLGVKLGRTSGLNLGHSQIANPIYLARKGSYPWSHALGSMARNTLANLGRSLRPEPYIDRYGRLRGNVVAFGDLLRGRLDPNNVLGLSRK